MESLRQEYLFDNLYYFCTKKKDWGEKNNMTWLLAQEEYTVQQYWH